MNKGYNIGWFSGQFFHIFEFFFCFFVVICDLMLDVEAIFHLPLMLTIDH